MSFHSSANFSRLLQQRLLPATNLFKLSNYDFSSTAQLPAAQAQRTSALPLRNLPYFVRRTPSNQLPVYTATQTGGTRQQTKVQKTEGDLNVMREHMAKALGIDGLNDVSISRGVDGQIYIVVEVSKFLFLFFTALFYTVSFLIY